MPIQGFLNDLYKGTVSSDEDGQYRGTGFGALILKPLVDEENIESTKQQGAVKRQFAALGENAAEYNLGPGATIYDAQGAVASKNRERESDRDKINYERQLKPLELQLAQQSKAADRTHSLALMQMADNKDARASELAYQKMRDRRADMEYNERMERLDRKDRQAMMQNLAAGLASLGAAFAL